MLLNPFAENDLPSIPKCNVFYEQVLILRAAPSFRSILFIGYQAMGTLGREILDGAKKVRILGQWYPVRARVEQLLGFSAHADREELLTWLKACAPQPRRIFVTHGEAATALAFSALVQEKTGWPATAPVYNQREVLS